MMLKSLSVIQVLSLLLLHLSRLLTSVVRLYSNPAWASRRDPMSHRLQVTATPPRGAGTAAWRTTLTCTCSAGTTPTTTSREALRMRTTRCSGSSGGTTSPRAPGSRFERRATCPQSWRPCQVKGRLRGRERFASCSFSFVFYRFVLKKS